MPTLKGIHILKALFIIFSIMSKLFLFTKIDNYYSQHCSLIHMNSLIYVILTIC